MQPLFFPLIQSLPPDAVKQSFLALAFIRGHRHNAVML